MKPRHALLVTTGIILTSAVGCSQLATVQGPEYRQRLSRPHDVAVQLNPEKADVKTFHAELNGQDVTDAFGVHDGTAVFSGYLFEPTAAKTPHTLTVMAEPSVNEKGKPMGAPFSETLVFFPPALDVQGNVGLGSKSHIDVPSDGRASVMVKLPAPVLEPTQVTVTPTANASVVAADPDAGTMTECVSLEKAMPGEPITVTIKPGNRVAVFTVHGKSSGISSLRLTSPGYVVADIDVFVDGLASTASVDTGY